MAQLLTATRLNVHSLLCVFSPSLFSLLTVFIFFVVVIADAAACVFLENTSWACCKHASSEGFWLPFDSADRRAFIVTDGSINTMKLNLSSAVCLYLYMYARVSVSSPAYIDFLPLSTISVHSALLPLQEIFFSVFLHHPPQPLLRIVGTFLGFLCFFGKAVSLEFQLSLSLRQLSVHVC